MRILWYPKRWREIRHDSSVMFMTSNRMRVYNFHACLSKSGEFRSEIAGYTAAKPHPFQFDVVVFQKRLNLPLAFWLRKLGVVTLLDVCDPVERVHHFRWCLDGIVASNSPLAAELGTQRLGVPIQVVPDAYEADELRLKRHQSGETLRVSWYGTWHSSEIYLKPLLNTIRQTPGIHFEWAIGQEYSDFWAQEGNRPDVKFHMSMEEAWRRPDSWQNFIYQSDVGVVPADGSAKSNHKIMNYMAYGIPVVCSPSPPHRELIRDGQNGFFAESETDWGQKLSLLRDPILRQRLGQAARQTVLGRHNIGRMAQQYAMVIKAHAERRKGLAVRARRALNRLCRPEESTSAVLL
jgi:glycosyltransferase involved in cell wall biosynthesis